MDHYSVKKLFAFLVCVLPLVASSQVSGVYGVASSLPLVAPKNTDPAPIIGGAYLGEVSTGFTGQYWSDPVLGWGYNINLSGGSLAEFASAASYTTASGTTTTSAAFSGTQTYNGVAWISNQFINWTICDLTHTGCSLITANTSGSSPAVTLNTAITGMTSGDTVQIAPDMWSTQLRQESDYEHEVGSSYTLASGTTSTVASFSGTPTYLGYAWISNQFIDWVLYDATRSASAVILANTTGATPTITVQPAISGMTSGDTVYLVRRDVEFGLGEVNIPGSTAAGLRVAEFNVISDKGTAMATGYPAFTDVQQLIPSAVGGRWELFPDSCYKDFSGACGAGSNDVFSIQAGTNAVQGLEGNTQITFAGYSTSNLVLSSNSSSQVYWFQQYNGNSSQQWNTGYNGTRGGYQIEAYSSAGTAGYHLIIGWDPPSGSDTITFGNTTDNFVYHFAGNGLAKIDGAAVSGGTKFTAAGTGCTVGTTTGSGTAGTFQLATGPCTSVAITLNGATGVTAPNGWSCQAHDRTAPTVLIGGESSSTTTTATITIPSGAGTSDVISFSCVPF